MERRARGRGALVAGVVVGAAAFLVLLGAGWLFYQRLYGNSWPALIVILLLAAVFGGYAAWLVGVIVFSTLRSPEENEG
jgi:hypothetical protein